GPRERGALGEASYFVERLAEARMPLAGLVLNRVHRSPATRLSAARSLAAAEALVPAGAAAENAYSAGGNDGAGALADVTRYPLAVAALRLHAERGQLVASGRRLAPGFPAAHPGVPVGKGLRQPD